MNPKKIATIGMTERQIKSFLQLMKMYGNQIKSTWVFVGNHEPHQVISTMGSNLEGIDILFADVNSVEGRLAWYTLKAVFDEDIMVAVTNEPQCSDARWFIHGATLNWIPGKSSDINNVLQGIESIISILNRQTDRQTDRQNAFRWLGGSVIQYG
jgi:hypothetical protein